MFRLINAGLLALGTFGLGLRLTGMLYYLASPGWSLVFRSRRGNNSLKKCRSRFERDPLQAPTVET